MITANGVVYAIVRRKLYAIAEGTWNSSSDQRGSAFQAEISRMLTVKQPSDSSRDRDP